MKAIHISNKALHIINKVGLFLVAIVINSAMTYAQVSSIDSILSIVSANNLELKALSHEHAARTYEMQSENTLSGPSVEYSPFYTKGYHGMASSELIVSQEFDFPTLYNQRRQQTRLEQSAMESQYETRRREIMLQARLLIYDIIRQNQLLELLEERLAQGEHTTQLIQKRLQAGDANVLELNKAKLEQKTTTQELAQAQNTRQAILLELQMLAGNKSVNVPNKAYPETDEISNVQLSQEDVSPDISLPEIREAEQALAASQHEEKLSRQSWLPSLSIGYRRNTEENTRLNGFLVGASFPLFSNATRQKAAHQRTLSNELRLQETQQQAQILVQQRRTELERLHAVLDHSDTQLLRETLDLLSKAMQYGQITALQYYTECTEIYKQLANHIDLHCQYVKAYAELYLR